MGFLGSTEVKNLPVNSGYAGDTSSTPESGRSPGGGNGNPLQYSCWYNSHGQRSLVGYSPWGHKELDRTEWTHTHIYATYTWMHTSHITDTHTTTTTLGIYHPRPLAMRTFASGWDSQGELQWLDLQMSLGASSPPEMRSPPLWRFRGSLVPGLPFPLTDIVAQFKKIPSHL